MVRIGDGLKLNHPGMEIATSIRWWMEQFRIRGTSDALLDINPTQLTTRFLPSFLSSSPHKHCANISSLMTYPTSTPNGYDTGLRCCRMGCNIFWRLTGCTKIMNSAWFCLIWGDVLQNKSLFWIFTLPVDNLHCLLTICSACWQPVFHSLVKGWHRHTQRADKWWQMQILHWTENTTADNGLSSADSLCWCWSLAGNSLATLGW